MLKEFKNVSQQSGNQLKRRWFSDELLDLTIWYNSNDEIEGFQLCYELGTEPHAFTWKKNSGSTHLKIDQGDENPRRNLAPILVPNGIMPKDYLLATFTTQAKELEYHIVELVLEKIREASIFNQAQS